MDKLVVDDFTVGYLEYTREATCSGTDGCKYLIASATVSDLEAKKALSRSSLLYTSPRPRDGLLSRMPSSA